MQIWLRAAIVTAALAAAQPAASATAAISPAFDAAIAASRSAMMASPSDALRKAIGAGRIAAALPPGKDALLATATAKWLEGEASARLNAPRRALAILEHALATVDRVDPRNHLHGDILLSRGWAEGATGAVPQALQDFQSAYSLFHALGETRGQAKALQNIAGIYHDAGDDRRSLLYSAQVAEIAANDPPIALAAFNNVGEALKTLGRYAAAEGQYRSALKAARKLGSPLLEVRILTNLASAQVRNRELAGADATVRQALALSASGEAAGDRPFVWGMVGEIAAARGDYARAGEMMGRTFEGVDLRTSTLPYREFHEEAADIYRHLGRSDLAYAHLAAFKRLDDGARALAASTNAALMAAKFDFTSQDLRITRLKTEQLQDRARLHLVVFSIALGAGGVVFLLLLWSALSLRRSRNKVRAANALLTESNRSLEKALKVKTDFLATTSHEIRTPLNGILGMTQVILADPATAAGVRDRIEVVHSAGETMRALVDDILDISKIETGNLSVRNAPLDLRRLLQDARTFWQGQADTKGLALTLVADGVPHLIMGDEARLRQIVFNIMSNALKFTAEGSVTLTAQRETLSERELLHIAVSDSGIGIPESELERIFEKFHQVDGGTARRFGGTGLGLAICRSLAEAMGGTIEVASREGDGATFTLRLPLCVSTAAPVQPDDAVTGPARGDLAARDVLLVDANPLGQRILGKALRASVRSVEAGATIEDAAAMLRSRRFGLLLVQAEAAGTAPDAVAAIARLIEGADGVPAVVLHGASLPFDVAGLARSGATLVAKPISGPGLVAALQALCEERDDDGVPQRLVYATKSIAGA